jgi:hypothetical protein
MRGPPWYGARVRIGDKPFVYLIGDILKVIAMAPISLKLPDGLLETSAGALRLPRAEYIRRAIERMNRETQAQVRATRLAEASRRVRGESMRVNAEFAAVEQDPAE